MSGEGAKAVRAANLLALRNCFANPYNIGSDEDSARLPNGSLCPVLGITTYLKCSVWAVFARSPNSLLALSLHYSL